MLKSKWLFLLIFTSVFLFWSLNSILAFAEDNNATIKRLSGGNRYETSLAISKANWTQTETVIIASGLNYPDALAAASLSKLKDAPILLTGKDSIEPSIIVEIKRLKATKAILVGGTGVIGSDVENQVKNLGIGITRVGGADRYDTSKKVAEMIGVNKGIIVVAGSDFPSALSIAPISSMKAIPILLSPKNSLDPNIQLFIKDKSIPVSYLVGETGMLDTSIDSSVPNSKRISGADKYATNVSINSQFDDSLNFNTIYLASGNDFPDALSGSALAAKNNAPIILSDGNSISDETINFIINKKVKHVVILGGIGAISQNVEDIIKGIIDNPLVHVKSVNINKTTDILAVGDSDTLNAAITPDTASNKYVIWKSSDDEVATVDTTGNVNAVSTGIAMISATTADGNNTANCEIIVTEASEQPIPENKESLIFAIDIGHNSKYDSGAVGIRSEDVCTKEVGTRVMEKLRALGYTVIDCSTTNPTSLNDSLKQRVDIANAAHADYFLSIHFNKFNGSASGSEVYMGSNRIKSKAQQVLNNLVSLGYKNRGLQDNSRGLYVLKNTKMPAMLVECSFLDSKDDMARYDPDAIADALVNGLIE